jgi:hypothetical protein
MGHCRALAAGTAICSVAAAVVLAAGTYQTGVAGICAGGWYSVQFDNLTVAAPS